MVQQLWLAHADMWSGADLGFAWFAFPLHLNIALCRLFNCRKPKLWLRLKLSSSEAPLYIYVNDLNNAAPQVLFLNDGIKYTDKTNCIFNSVDQVHQCFTGGKSEPLMYIHYEALLKSIKPETRAHGSFWSKPSSDFAIMSKLW